MIRTRLLMLSNGGCYTCEDSANPVGLLGNLVRQLWVPSRWIGLESQLAPGYRIQVALLPGSWAK